MVTEEDIRQGFQNLAKKQQPVSVLAEVKSVDQQNRTCTLDDDGLMMYGVRLQCITQGNTGILMIPKIGSRVLAVQIEETDQYMVVQAAETESVEINIGQQKIVMDQNGIVLNDGTIGMVKCDKMVEWMAKVYADMQAIQLTLMGGVTTPAGPGSLTVAFTGSNTPNPDVTTFADDNFKH